MTIIVICLLIGFIPAAIAQSKGRNFIGWYLFGVLLFIVALPCALLVSNLKIEDAHMRALAQLAESASMKTCPQCAERVQGAAKVCRYCQYTFAADGSDLPPLPAKPYSPVIETF